MASQAPSDRQASIGEILFSGQPNASLLQRAVKRLSEAEGFENVVTSIPDFAPNGLEYESYEQWVTQMVELCIEKTDPNGYIIFHQMDRKVGDDVLDMSHLIIKSALDAGALLRWHRFVVRHQNLDENHQGDLLHLLCFSKKSGPNPAKKLIQDVLFADASGLRKAAIHFSYWFVSKWTHNGN